MMKKSGVQILAVCLLSFTAGCSDSSTGSGSGSVPDDHTIRKGGAYHKAGLTAPETNCTQCHGTDLKGGSSKTSCYSCHGKVW
ncbi:MAG: hypothetical protein L6Q77_15510 [Bacteroidetes bacterium]|nr:hypothetical protein [Bacteroidota bacterium]